MDSPQQLDRQDHPQQINSPLDKTEVEPVSASLGCSREAEKKKVLETDIPKM